MNKYTNLSDFEINKKVADRLGFKSEIRDDETWLFNKVWIPYDPCNNVEQAWEIMMKYNIGVVKNYTDGSWVAISAIGECEHEKPLVAAMLCFLEL